MVAVYHGNGNIVVCTNCEIDVMSRFCVLRDKKIFEPYNFPDTAVIIGLDNPNGYNLVTLNLLTGGAVFPTGIFSDLYFSYACHGLQIHIYKFAIEGYDATVDTNFNVGEVNSSIHSGITGSSNQNINFVIEMRYSCLSNPRKREHN